MMRFNSLSIWLTVWGLLALPGMSSAEELPIPIKALEARGVTIVGQFAAPGGLKGYAARYNGQGMALYLTEDGQHVLVGTLFDARGEDLTRAPMDKLVYEPMAKEMWARMEKSTWISDGRDDAPRVVYLFDDPNCPYCNLFWQQARPWVDSGKVQLRHIMVGMLSADSAGKAAALLIAHQPEAALHKHELAGKSSTLKPLPEIPADIQEQLDANLALMGELGTAATPAIFYRDGEGHLKMQQGLPPPEGLGDIFGRR
ncbi:Thiol:disulfide interchange protein DsbG [compost metagenome]